MSYGQPRFTVKFSPGTPALTIPAFEIIVTLPDTRIPIYSAVMVGTEVVTTNAEEPLESIVDYYTIPGQNIPLTVPEITLPVGSIPYPTVI